jgi:outer membrane lipoprotein-sorting protein
MVAKSTIEQTASKQITDRLGGGTYTVTCPHDLAAKRGASMTCVTNSPDGEKFSGTATVTSVSEGTALWAYRPSSKPVK